jgi:hypothetical protein
LDGVDIVRVVDTLELGPKRGTRYERDECVVESGSFQATEHRVEPRRTLGVTASREVVEVALVARQQHRHGGRG